FYRVNAYLKPEAYVLHNISNSTHQQYLEHFQPLDPLSPSRFGGITVATHQGRFSIRHIPFILQVAYVLATDYFGYKRGCLFAITCPIW
ncbi:hypothetical protein MJI37_30485, partial [Salmonella enterica subsp. enterica serovar Cerro]|nr:hypothetical protein [Salmonella enterica subsp. enterica serovar Cerro]